MIERSKDQKKEHDTVVYPRNSLLESPAIEKLKLPGEADEDVLVILKSIIFILQGVEFAVSHGADGSQTHIEGMSARSLYDDKACLYISFTEANDGDASDPSQWLVLDACAELIAAQARAHDGEGEGENAKAFYLDEAAIIKVVADNHFSGKTKAAEERVWKLGILKGSRFKANSPREAVTRLVRVQFEALRRAWAMPRRALKWSFQPGRVRRGVGRRARGGVFSRTK